MTNASKLTTIKIIHTIVWLFFNVVIFYMLYAVIVNQIDYRLWLGYLLILAEGITLMICGWACPLTLIARKYSDSDRHNFDIYLPNWLAKHNKLIYCSIMGVIIILTLVRLYA